MADDFIVIGEWVDQEYVSLQARSLTESLSRDDVRRLIAGPRRHPFDPTEACVINIDGQWVVFPSMNDADIASDIRAYEASWHGRLATPGFVDA